MLNMEVNVSRRQFFWQEVSLQMVEAYLKELNEMKEKLASFDFDYEHTLFGSKELLSSVNSSIDTEIKYCEFFKEYRSRRENEPLFDQWVFTKKEDIIPQSEWNPPQGEQWTKTNGRVKAIIQFDRSGLSTKITLDFKNSSPLDFLDSYRKPQPSDRTHLRNEASINKKIEEFKARADAFLKEHEFPRYEHTKRDLDILKRLLCIEG